MEASAIRQHYPFSGKLIRVRVDEFDVDGHSVTREVVEHPGAVAVVAVTTDEQVILVRQWRHPIGERTLEIPAGIVDAGESASDAAARELFEETGYRPGAIREILNLLPSPGYTDERITLFLATRCDRHSLVAQDAAVIDFELVAFSVLRSILGPGEGSVVDAKTFAGLMWLTANWPIDGAL